MTMKHADLPHLFSPLTIGNLELRNRIVMPAMGTRYPTYGGKVTDRLIHYYAERAKGGVGLIIVQFATILMDGRSSMYPLAIWDDAQIPGLRRLAQAIRKEGVPSAIQLAHAGAAGKSEVTGVQPVGPSAVPCPGREAPRELSVGEIEALVDAFGEAAKRAMEAGFDAVELHMAHGYLLQQFLSPLNNLRNDAYGGDFDRRLIFPIQVLDRVRDVVGPETPILCRLCVDEGYPTGITQDVGVRIARALELAGADVIDVSGGAVGTFHFSVPSQTDPPGGSLLPLAAAVKKVVQIPVVAVGKLHDPMIMEQVLAEGKADLVAVGRGLIADAELPRKIMEGRWDRIRPCLTCERPECHGRILSDMSMGCVVNPQVGREADLSPRPAEVSRRVLVIGGGPAAMEAALAAAQSGHQVTLCEKRPYLGGQVYLGAKAPHKQLFQKLLDYYATRLDDLHVRVELECPVDIDQVISLAPEVVIVATGARPCQLDVPGRGPQILTAWDVLRGASTGQSVVVVGGGSVGCETAEFLALQGRQVVILEMLDQVARDLARWTRPLLIKRLMALDVEILVRCKAVLLDGRKVVYDRGGMLEVIHNVDTVVSATGAVSDDHLSATLREHGFDPILAGDCLKPGNAGDAIRAGFEAGLKVV
jgi:2,4-dienoyl-CoA reductase-like NADH-dependent reductase (Old Yellow Enzyme family)/thioredoxin reductase